MSWALLAVDLGSCCAHKWSQVWLLLSSWMGGQCSQELNYMIQLALEMKFPLKEFG